MLKDNTSSNQNPSCPTEADWRYFRSILDELLEKLSRRHCDHIRAILGQTDTTEDKKRHLIYKTIHKDNKEVALLFDNPRRSVMNIQCAGMFIRDIITPEHLKNFTPGFQEWLNQMKRHAND